MSEKQKRMITETVENLKQMNEESLLLMKSNSDVLAMRDALDRRGAADEINNLD